MRRTYWPSLPGLASSAGDGGRSCIPLRDSSGLTPDSLSCPRALRRHRDLRGSSRSRRRTNCTVDSRGLGSSEETPDLRTRLDSCRRGRRVHADDVPLQLLLRRDVREELRRSHRYPASDPGHTCVSKALRREQIRRDLADGIRGLVYGDPGASTGTSGPARSGDRNLVVSVVSAAYGPRPGRDTVRSCGLQCREFFCSAKCVGSERSDSQHSQNSPTHTTELRRFSLFPSRRVLHTLRTSPGRSVASRPSSSTRRRHNRRTSS